MARGVDRGWLCGASVVAIPSGGTATILSLLRKAAARMENQGNGRVILAVALAFAVLFLWSYLFPGKQPPPKLPASLEAAAAAAPLRDDPLPQEQEFAFKGRGFEAVISSHGARIKSWKILDAQYAAPNGAPLDLITKAPGLSREPWPGEVSLLDPDADLQLPRTMVFQEVKESSDGAGTLRLRWENDFLALDKVFQAQGDSVKMSVVTRNKGKIDRRIKLALAIDGYQDPNKMEGTGFFIFKSPPDLANPTCYINGENKHIVFAKEDLSESSSGAIGWFGINRTYFLKAMYPLEPLKEGEAASCAVSTESSGAERSLLAMPSAKLAAGATLERSFGLFFGPKKLDVLEDKGHGLAAAIDYGWLGFLSRPMLMVLKWSYGVVGNWGVAVIMLTLLVRLLMFYPAHRSFKSMQGMAALKPKLDALKEKYKDDQQAFAQAQMALMRQEGVSPLGGCLPLLLQMPFFFALYRMIYQAVDLYQADMGLWIHDLSVADPYFILPVVLGVVMYLQQKLTPTNMDATQARVMQWMLPIMMFLFMAFLPAALVLYTLTSTLFGFAQQYIIKRMNPTPAPSDPTISGGAPSKDKDAMAKALAERRERQQSPNAPRAKNDKRRR